MAGASGRGVPVTSSSTRVSPWVPPTKVSSAAGSPRVSNSVGNDATTREGGLTNIGSNHPRAATSQKKSRRTTTPARATHGRCIVWDVIIAGAFRAPRAPRRAY